MIGGSCSQDLKKAIINPLIEKPSLCKEGLFDYRPLSGSYISELLEWVIATQLCEHLLKNLLVNSLQSAYKPYHSTETALLNRGGIF